MDIEVVVRLPEEIYRRAEQLAQKSGREVADILATTLEISTPLGTELTAEAFQTLSDDIVVAIAKSQMDSVQNTRMSALLDKQQAVGLTEAENNELSLLMYVYETGSLRKAYALAEAARRGLDFRFI
jgi:hypothetical protein